MSPYVRGNRPLVRKDGRERSAYMRAYYLANKAKWRARNEARRGKGRFGDTFWHKYRITIEEFDAMYERQGGVCAICETPKPKGGKAGMHVDHDHETGRFRGLLCGPCNRALGWVENDEWRARAEQYLRERNES